ncbi:MAG: MerR family DNA-binding transcriptional regulator [Neomegalonema sp.]|nr:MerR family DNA-binding transcriptional regulator [Neomegalonema sp.]
MERETTQSERLSALYPAPLDSAAALEKESVIFSIRDLCDAFDVTPRALRFYEDQGLIFPKRDGQKRIYSARDRARLKLIIRGKRFGFSLAEVRELLDLYDLGDRQRTQLTATLDKAREKLEMLEARKNDIAAAIDELREHMDLVENMLVELSDKSSTDGD